MRIRLSILISSTTLSLCAVGCSAAAAADSGARPIVAQIEITHPARAVSRYEYGMFIENLGQLVYRSLWAQMLDDRKFFEPIRPARAVPAKPATGFARVFVLRRWHPIGAPAAVTMDPHRPFVGAHSPRIALAGHRVRGIRQQGLAVLAGKRYTGYIYLRGSPDAHVQVRLRWGPAPHAASSVRIGALTRHYRRYPFAFTAGANSGAASFSVRATGHGSVHIGTLSLMPADNIEGFRRDSIDALRQLHSGFWRLPGGNFISDFNWYASVGNRDKRRPYLDHAWNSVQSNDVGLDEFMTLCHLLHVAPYVTVNAGFGDAHSAAAEVRYLNAPVSTRLGALRARNGHPRPYDVKFWNIGNEPYGPWQLGHTSLQDYVWKNNEFARAMRRADPHIVLLASGAMPDEMTVEGIARELGHRSDQIALCSNADWTCAYLEHSWGDFQGITEHWYARAGMRFDLARARAGLRIDHMEPGYVPAHESVQQWVRTPAQRVRLKAEEWQAYERRFPAMRQAGIFMSIDEYAYTGAPANLKLALAYAMVLNEMLRHTDFLRMAAFTMGVSTIDFTRTHAALNTTGLLFKLYGQHFGAGLLPVPVDGDAPPPPPRQQWVPGIAPQSAGSPTYPLDVEAALTPDHRHLVVAVVNPTARTEPLALHLRGATVRAGGHYWEMTGPGLAAANDIGHPPEVQVREHRLTGVSGPLRIAPISIDIYRLRLSGSAP
ncbi:MAG: alpha-L-arabinofuranosidase C-terminal domain-containing protein [Steroidobacteraceae bacterium]